MGECCDWAQSTKGDRYKGVSGFANAYTSYVY